MMKFVKIFESNIFSEMNYEVIHGIDWYCDNSTTVAAKYLYIDQMSLQRIQTEGFLNLRLLLQIKYNANQCFVISPLDLITI